MQVRMDGGPVNSIAFRTDGQEVLATSNANGNIALWDLNEGGRLSHIIRGAHDAEVTSIQWIPGQPVLISSGNDNSVKVALLKRTYNKLIYIYCSNGYLIRSTNLLVY